MTDTVTAPAFTFEDCPEADACKDGMRPLLAAGMDWSEVHCGRCGRQGVVRHADLGIPGTAVPTVAEVEPEQAEPAPEAIEAPADKGRNR